MTEYPQHPPRNFLGLPPEHSDFAASRALILPVPYDATTSYKGGAKAGPQAVIDASTQVELYDRELDDEPALRWGVYTLPALAPDLRSPEATIMGIAEAVSGLARTGKLLCVLGGEHSVSVGVARGLHDVFGDFLTVQLDAHADLRDEYDGTPYSHACAARRIAEIGPVIQLGIRSLDAAEATFLRENPARVTAFFAEDMHRDRSYLQVLAERVRGQRVFLTIDLDVLDPAIMPATGTPEPGGLGWYDTLDILRIVCAEAEVIAFDCVELSPLPGLHAPEFLAAKLVYKTLSLILSRQV
ncbi:MAG: agmatinase [Armatimonadetes bacterium]|nr:agmatinase [Armatimonadota bacterium]